MTVRAIVRVSSLTKVGQQIEQAKHEIQRWADFEREGEPIVFYVDKNISAAKKKFTERPESGKAWKESVAGDTIVTNKLDRAFRNTMDCLDIAEQCDKLGINLAITTMKIDTTTSGGRLVLTTLAGMAQFEADQVKERVKAAIQTFRREGRHWGDKPFGFHSVDNPNGKGLVLRPILFDGPCDMCRVKEQDSESGKWYDTEEPLTHFNEGGRLRNAVLEYARTDATQAKLAESLGLPEASFRKLLSNERLYGKTPGGQTDPEQALISKAEFQAIRERLGGPREWTRTDSLARALKCYHCKRHLYYDKHGEFYRCEAPKKEHEGAIRATVSRKIADEFLERFFLDNYQDKPYYEMQYADDSDHAERLADVEIELQNATDSLRDSYSTILVEEIERLHQEKQAIEDEPMNSTPTMVATGETMGQRWDNADRVERVALLNRVTIEAGQRFVLGPAKWGKNRIVVHDDH